MVMLTDSPDMTIDVYGGRKTTTQHLGLKGKGFLCGCRASGLLETFHIFDTVYKK